MPAVARPGASMPDAPLDGGWLLNRLGDGFKLLFVNCAPEHVEGLHAMAVAADETMRERFLGAADSAVYLIRPDQHVAARWTKFDAMAVLAALDKAKGF